jgi:hypothetical protein
LKLRALASGEIEEASRALDQPLIQVVVFHDYGMLSAVSRLRPIRIDAL